MNGFDFVNRDGSVFDGPDDDHATHVAGTIGGKGGNGLGVAGVNWNVTMISAKFLGTSGGTTADAVLAVDYITSLKQKYGLNIVATSNSWGGGGFSQALLDAIERGGDAGILFIAAAGNSTSNNDAGSYYPSGYQCTNGGTRGFDCVVAVASTTSTGGLSSFSSYGVTTVDIAAPGSSIVSTIPGATYASYSGTSMATPHVSGAAALCKAANMAMTASQIRSAVVESVRTTDSLAGKTANAGRLDISALLKRCVSPAAALTGAPSSLVPTALGQGSVRLDWIDGASNETGYVIQRALSATGVCGSYATIGNLGADNNRYYSSGLQSDTTYCFRVGANSGADTQWSDVATITTPSLPSQYVCAADSYSWVTPPSTAASYSLTDDSSVTVSIPFGFDLYGTTATSLKISSNGYIRFDGGSATQYANSTIPSTPDPNAMAAAWWMDFDPSRGGQIRSHVIGTAPSRTMVVSWIGLMPFSTSATNGASFQILLDEASRSIEFQYQDTLVGTSTIDRGRTGTVGIESSDGTYGTQVLFNTASLTDLSAVRCARSTVPLITTTSLASGVVSEPYSQSISVSGGTGTKTLSLDSGSLPPGLSISGMSIVGTPTTAGTWPFTLRVQDQNNVSSSTALQIVIADPIGLTSSPMPAATVGSSYSQSMSVSGGIAPYAWSLASGSLPAGLSLSTGGVITGTPTTSAKSSSFTAKVTDSMGKTATSSLNIRVNVSITTATVASATQGTSYSQTLVSVGGATGATHSWSVSSGSLPAGLSLSTGGLISGVPSSSATTQTFTVDVGDGTLEGKASATYTLTVVVPLVVTTTSLANAPIGSSYSQTLTTSGASGATTWSLTSGSLPAGLSLNTSTGVISGTTASNAVSSTFTVRAADSAGKSGTRQLSISVVAATIPANFNKLSPYSGATKISRGPTLSWGSSARAVRFEYCVDRTNNATCDSGNWISVGSSSSIALSGLAAKTTYYWQVRAVNSIGEMTNANSGTWWRFTTA